MNRIYKTAEGERLVRERYLAFLKHWPVAHHQIRIPTRQGETFIVVCGAEGAPPLLLLHGGAGNSAMWMNDVRTFAGQFSGYAIDMIGEAGLSAPSGPPLASDAYAVWLDEVLQGLFGRSHLHRWCVTRRVARAGLRDAPSRTRGKSRGSVPERDWKSKGWHPFDDHRATNVWRLGEAETAGTNSWASAR